MMQRKTKVSLVMCNDMHMDIEKANEIFSYVSHAGNYEICSEYTRSDIVIIMTCAFGNKKEYSMNVISDVLQNVKKSAKVIVTGCLVYLKRLELEAIEGVEVKTFEEVKNFFVETENVKTKKFISQNKVIISTGCRKRCTYCVYPQFAGNYESKPMEDILEEVEAMYNREDMIYISGALETSDYGIDLYGEPKLAELMDKICEKFPNSFFTIGWLHPSGLTSKLFEVIKKHKNIVKVMVHIQHVNSFILQYMNRPPFDITEEKLVYLKTIRPDIMISTEVIVGFPGESEQKFQELISYLDKCQKKEFFSDIGVASFEPVEHTTAACLSNLPFWSIRNERMKFICERYKNTTAYPAPSNDCRSILSSFFEAKNVQNLMPKLFLTTKARLKTYPVAGVDTEFKSPNTYVDLAMKILDRIKNTRDSNSKTVLMKNMKEVYTEEFRQSIYSLYEMSNIKAGLLKDAKLILLGIN